MTVFIRAYGSHLMGMGHLYRIEKLVKQLRKEINCNITLFTRKFDESVSIYEKIDVDKVIEISQKISIDKEVKELESVLINGYDILINDQLNTDIEIANILTKYSKKHITFDDLGDGNYLFEHIINVLYPSNKKLDNEINLYSYMLLNDYSNIKAKVTFKEDVRTIFINQGAADTWGAIPDMIKDLNLMQYDFKIKVLLGPSFQHFDELAEVLKSNETQIEIFNFTDSVVKLVKDCDLAILGAGNTLFEVASLGIPIIASTREEKELITIDRLLKDNIVYAINTIYKDGLNNLVKEVIEDKSGREIKYTQNRELFQYDGLKKIVKLIVGG